MGWSEGCLCMYYGAWVRSVIPRSTPARVILLLDRMSSRHTLNLYRLDYQFYFSYNLVQKSRTRVISSGRLIARPAVSMLTSESEFGGGVEDYCLIYQ